MKTKDFKTGVAYVRKLGGRYHSAMYKGVIVSLDKRYAQPSQIMQQGFKTVVEESKGSGACYLVIESGPYCDTEELIKAAAEFSLPATGETWPYLLSRVSLKKKRDSWGTGVERVDYLDDDLPFGMAPALWLPQAFDHEFLSAEDSQNRHDAKRQKLIETRQKNRTTKKQRIESLLNGISDLKLEGVTEADVRNKDGKRRSTVPVSVDVLEALLKRAG